MTDTSRVVSDAGWSAIGFILACLLATAVVMYALDRHYTYLDATVVGICG